MSSAQQRTSVTKNVSMVLLLCAVWMSFVTLTEGFVSPVLAAKLASVIIVSSGFLPAREDLPSSVTIPTAITKFYPLPGVT